MNKTDQKLKDMATMTVGVTPAGELQPNEALTLHDELVSVIISDGEDTIVQYGNGAQRLFKTRDLAAYRELHTFPSSTRFTRPSGTGMEAAYIEHVTEDGYVLCMIDAQGEELPTSVKMSYAGLMAWHMAGGKNP